MPDLVADWSRRFAAPTSGWDFSALSGRVSSQDPPWSYTALAREAVGDATSVLDLGTGGGERLLTLADILPADTHATEGWAPNVPVARLALAPHGIGVVAHDPATSPLPFPDARFDVVLDRQTAYEVADVARVLRPGGQFLTQQVDGRNLDDLAATFGASAAFGQITLPILRAEAEEAGLQVLRGEEWSGTVRFADVATLLEQLRTMPWQLPADFTVERYADELLALHGTPLEFTERRLLLHARRPPA